MTRRLDSAKWNELEESFSPDCVAFARKALARDGLVELRAEEMGGFEGCDRISANALLQQLTELEAVERVEVTSCAACGQELSDDETEEQNCVYCGSQISGNPSALLPSRVYRREAQRSRSVPWVLVLHGMNTRGAWQERFSWLVATTYGRSVPVFIYKYGLVRPGVLLRARQGALSRDVATKLRRLAQEQRGSSLGSRPDVIAHSFGTWLLGHALVENGDLRVGRVILMGSVLRPDFSWRALQQRGQVDAVLNHAGGKDPWVRLAAYFIPDSGPSGKTGFNPESGVIHRLESDFGHSTYFRSDAMPRSYEGVWRPFLQRPRERLQELETGPRIGRWTPPPWILRATVGRLVLLILGVAILLALVASLVVGAADLLLRHG